MIGMLQQPTCCFRFWGTIAARDDFLIPLHCQVAAGCTRLGSCPRRSSSGRSNVRRSKHPARRPGQHKFLHQHLDSVLQRWAEQPPEAGLQHSCHAGHLGPAESWNEFGRAPASRWPEQFDHVHRRLFWALTLEAECVRAVCVKLQPRRESDKRPAAVSGDRSDSVEIELSPGPGPRLGDFAARIQVPSPAAAPLLLPLARPERG